MLSFSKRIGALSSVLLLAASASCGVSPLRARPDPDAGHDLASDSGKAGNTGQAGDSGQVLDAGPDGGGDTPQEDRGSGTDGIGSDADGSTMTISSDARRDGADTGTDSAGDTGDARGDARSDGTTAAVCAACTSWGTPVAEGPSPAVLPELSGLAASHLHPGLLYTHNDSGDTARFFALTEQAHLNAEIHLTGATATDWEDISVGPCPTGSCVYIGDTGDNKVNRSEYVIYRVAEPATLPTDGSVIAVTYESFPFVYPDGSHNAETLLVHPTTGQVFIVIKESGIPATVYEMPLPLMAGTKVTLTMAGSLAIPPADGVVTDGSFHPCGDRLLIRTTSATGLYEMTRTPGDTLANLFGAQPVMVPVAVEPQGEGVTYAIDGRRYFTGSETVSGDPTPSISVVTCASP